MTDKVLVLGGSYFVGRKMVEFLAEHGYAVTVLNRGTRPLSVEGVQQICCDRNDGEGMKTALAGKEFDYVIDVSWQDVSWVEKLCAALPFESVKKFVFISSSAVYDVEHLQIPFSETDALAENKYWTFYGKGKIDAETYYSEFLKDKQMELVVVRPPYIYGEYNYAQRESLIFRQLMEDKPVVIPASNPKLQFIYTEDLAAIVECLLQTDTGKDAVFNVGNRKAVTSREWVEACAKVAGKKPEIMEIDYAGLGRNVRDFYPFFDYDNMLDVSKINKIICKETNFEEGLKKSFAWFLENRESIVFKENVDKNLYEIIAELSV
ncbi:MAG: NAD-dependent epimerase/dehydratase family protein [Lachnospiraceae bacterium]|nr:NAD-dependent epimerase/dehydratase family protein [Lachnospiraceae bacterium]